MPTSALLTLTQWLSPNFPLSSFAYSHGLETAIAAGWVTDAPTLEAWLRDVLETGAGQSDAIWLRLGHAAGTQSALTTLHAEACAFAPSSSRQREATAQGAAFAKTVNAIWDLDLPEVTLPLAVGAASRAQGLDIDQVVPLYLASFVSNLTAAAQRLMPVGQTDAQAIVARLHDLCDKLAQNSRTKSLDNITSTAFLSDIAAMRHDTLQPRLFQS